MRLHLITLTNFRQFAGVQKFDLMSDEIRPVSMIFGANGAGKTTLLNAFTWGLYGTLSDDVEQQDRMVTDFVWHRAVVGDTTEVAVELVFDHEGHEYRLLRSAKLRKESDQQPPVQGEVKLWITQSDGSSEIMQAPQPTIDNILPPRVSRFFFFNGERMEKLVKKGAYAEVQQDIKVLLDLAQVERALEHLPRVDRKLSAELRKHGGTKASDIQDSIDRLRDEEVEAKNSLRLLDSDHANLIEERDAVLDLLRQHNDARPIQERRDIVTSELNTAKVSLQSAELERRVVVATRGFLALTESLGDRTKATADALYEKGALPAPLKREFVDQLLEDGACICGTPLAEHSSTREHVMEWRHRAGLQAVETAWQKLSAQIQPLASARVDLRNDLSALMKRIGDEREKVESLVAQKSELDDKLKGSRLEGVQELESKRIDLENRIAAKNQKIGSVRSELERTLKDIDQKTHERSRAEVTDELAAKARARSDLVGAVKKALDEILAIREDEMRRRLDEKLKAIFKKIIKKNVTPALSEGFEINLFQDLGDGVVLPMPKSTGENQVLSVSFVAAVSELAREIRTERRAEGESNVGAGSYPIVMDAAFGSLDDNYQESVSDVLAKMAPQLIVLVSKSQGLGRVLPQLMPYVSHLGIIETHTTAEGNVDEDIEVGGVSHPYIRADDVDRAELKVIQ